MDAPAPPPTLNYERHRPQRLTTRLERRGLRLYAAGRWCLLSAATAVAISAVSLATLFLSIYLWPELHENETFVGLFAVSIVLSFILGLVVYPTGVILQFFGDAYRDRANALTHLHEH